MGELATTVLTSMAQDDGTPSKMHGDHEGQSWRPAPRLGLGACALIPRGQIFYCGCRAGDNLLT